MIVEQAPDLKESLFVALLFRDSNVADSILALSLINISEPTRRY